ncbi:hypothetical protein YC2023_101117 [Brassica napus]
MAVRTFSIWIKKDDIKGEWDFIFFHNRASAMKNSQRVFEENKKKQRNLITREEISTMFFSSNVGRRWVHDFGSKP